jgi:hypothetical protein
MNFCKALKAHNELFFLALESMFINKASATKFNSESQSGD